MGPREWIPASKNLIKDKWTSHISESLRRKDYCFKSQRAAAPDSSSNKSHYSADTSDLFAGWLIFRSLWAFLPFFLFFFFFLLSLLLFSISGWDNGRGYFLLRKKKKQLLMDLQRNGEMLLKCTRKHRFEPPTEPRTEEQICEAQLIRLSRRIAAALVGVSIASELKL